MEVIYDVAVIGGGPAGCAAAITAARLGYRTILFERGRYPRHKVCGEFVSPESHDLLLSLLGPNSSLLQAPATITQARMFSDDRQICFALPKPAWSIARYDLDHALWQAAQSEGVHCHDGSTVDNIEKNKSGMVLVPHICLLLADVGGGSKTIHTKVLINASGRWSNLRRPLLQTGPQWIGLKAHFSGENAPPSTDIYFFRGGYCGIQPIGAGTINASAMVRSDVATSLHEVFAANDKLWRRSRGWEQITSAFSTSPLIHSAPEPVTDGVMNAGDAAGFVDPFVGDGISLALRSGVLAAQCAGSPQRYAAEYRQRFANVFQTAAMARHLANAPDFFRHLAIYAFQWETARSWALNRTRAR